MSLIKTGTNISHTFLLHTYTWLNIRGKMGGKSENVNHGKKC